MNLGYFAGEIAGCDCGEQQCDPFDSNGWLHTGALVQQDDGSRLQTSFDSGDEPAGGRAAAVTTPHRPAYAVKLAEGQGAGEQHMFDADGGTKESRTNSQSEQKREGMVEFTREPSRRGAPESVSRMRVRVMSNLMAATRDLGDEMRPFFGLFTDDKKGGARAMMIQQIEDARGVMFVRAIVDRQPHRALIRRKTGEHAHEALRRRCHDRVEQKGIRREKHDRCGRTIAVQPQCQRDELCDQSTGHYRPKQRG